MNPTIIAALIKAAGSGISALGSHPAQQQFWQSYDASPATNPITLLSQAMQGINNAEVGLGNLPISTRSSYVQPGPAPINIPGVPFSLGAGRAVDPALSNPSLLNVDISPLFEAFKKLTYQQPSTDQVNPRKGGI